MVKMLDCTFRTYRRRFRAWRNHVRLIRERRIYDRLFAARGLALPDDEAVRTAMRKKYPQLAPKQKGSLHILALFHHYNWEDESLKPALEKFGAVRHYDWCEDFDHQSKDWHDTLKDRMNKELARKIAGWLKEDSTDIIFTYLSGEQVYPDTLAKIASSGIPSINLALNDKEHFIGRIRRGIAMGSRDICRHFDLCWTSTEDALKKYCVEGAVPVYLPEGANPDVHRPYEEEKVLDVSFAGQCYGNRPEVIGKLRSLGIPVEAYGSGWPNGPLPLEEMVRLYSRSRINLGFAGIAGHRDAFCLKGRDFEIPMSGGLYLTEHHPELERVYDIGREIVTFSGFDDLVEKIRFLLANPERAEEIRNRGYRRARRDHTWEMRFERIFSIMGLI
jgi:hypothetical protein